MRAIRKRLTFANVVACLALFVALGGASYAATQLPNNSVGPKQLKKNAVTAPKIKKEAVTAAKIKGGAIDATKVADGAISGAKIADGAVTGAKIADGAVTGAKIADGAVNGSKVADGSLTAAELAPGVIIPRTAKLQSGETMTGVVGIEEEAAAGSDFVGGVGSFQFLPPAPIPAANRHAITGASGPGCPGVGRADPGQLCVYQVRATNATGLSLYDEAGSPGEPSTYGFAYQLLSNAAGVVVFAADWAYTAP